MFHAKEENRLTVGKLATTKDNGANGVFYFPIKKKIPGVNRFLNTGWLQCVISDGMGWEHCSVCVTTQDRKEFQKRTPTWEEMAFCKDQFWDKTDICVQFHPDEAHYVNVHPGVLHIWRAIGSNYQLPSEIMI